MLYDKEAIETWIVVGHFQGVVGKQYGILKNHTLSPPAEGMWCRFRRLLRSLS